MGGWGWGEGRRGGWWGFPWLKMKKSLGFLVSWCRSFLLCFLVISFLGFFVSKIYQISILEDIDLISKICKSSLDGSSVLFGARLFPNRQQLDFRSLEIYKTNMF